MSPNHLNSFHSSPNGRGAHRAAPSAPTPPDPSPGGVRARLGFLRSRIDGTAAATSRVLRLVWQTSPKLTLLMAAVTLLQSVIPASQIKLAGLLIDEVVKGVRAGSGDTYLRPIVILALIQLGLLLASSLLTTLGNISQQLLQERLTIHVQTQIMEHANSLDLADFENAVYYDQLQQAQNESSRRPVMMVSQLFGLVQTAVTFVTLLLLLVQLSPWIAVVTLVSPIPAFISGSRYGWWGFQLMRRQSPMRRLMSYLTTLMTTDQYVKEVKLFTIGEHFLDRYRQVSSEYYEDTRKLLVRRYLSGFGWGALTILVSSGTFLYVAILALRGTITIGSLTVFTQAATQLQGAFQGLLTGVQGIYENGLYLTTLYDLLDRAPAITAPDQPVALQRPFTQGIEFRDVTYHYPGKEEPALAGVSFTIEPGETVALVGRNGAGKSTIVKLLGRLYDPTDGQILINGHDIREYDPHELRSVFGMMFQDFATYQFTAAENIGVGDVARVDDRAKIVEAAGQAGADPVIAKLPESFDTVLGKWFEGGHQLSGGEWQKVALARGFMRDAEILILDEPTSALDAKAEHDLFSRLKALAQGRIALFISHRFSTTRMADRILVLEGGRLVEQGTHDELMLLGGRYADLFELQAASYR